MAATPAQQRRYQAALRRVLARLRSEQPDTYRQWLAEALADYDTTENDDELHGET
jgi:hypothetical protein